jgi:hypothetical protein
MWQRPLSKDLTYVRSFFEILYMRRPFAFVLSIIALFIIAGFIFYADGLPKLREASMGCHFSGGATAVGCSTDFGTFMTFWGTGVALGIFAAWNRFGRY